MSAASKTGRSTGDYRELMRQMGAAPYEGFNPIAPRSHRWMMDVSQSEEIRVFGWALWRSIDRDPKGQTGPQKKTRTFFAHDARGQLGVKHLAEDLGLTVANATDALKRTVGKDLIRVDEKGRICPRGDIPEPTRTKSEDELDEDVELFCTENIPAPLSLSFQSLDTKRRAQYVRYYLAMPKPFAEHLAGTDPDRRAFHIWRYLERREYGEQLAADALAAARAKEQEELDRVFADAGYQDQERRGRPKVNRELTIELNVRVEADTFSVQKSNGHFVQNGNSHSYKNQNGSAQKSASLLGSHSSQSDQSEVQSAPVQKQANAPPSPPTPLNPKVQEIHENPVVAAVEFHFGRQLDRRLKQSFIELSAQFGIPAFSICRFLGEKFEKKEAARYTIENPGALFQIAEQDLPRWIKSHRHEIEGDFNWERAQRSNTPDEPFEPANYNAQVKSLAARKGMTGGHSGGQP